MHNNTKIITIQDEDEVDFLDVKSVFIAPKDLDEKDIKSHIKEFKKEKHNSYWSELSKSLVDKFGLKEISFECFYIQD